MLPVEGVQRLAVLADEKAYGTAAVAGVLLCLLTMLSRASTVLVPGNAAGSARSSVTAGLSGSSQTQTTCQPMVA